MSKKRKRKIRQLLLTSVVIAAFTTGFFSLIVSYNTNEKLESIERQKYEYKLEEIRYEKMCELLDFFTNFDVFDPEYIYNFDPELEEYSWEKCETVIEESRKELDYQIDKLFVYLSDDAVRYLMMNNLYLLVGSSEMSYEDELDDIEPTIDGMKRIMVFFNAEMKEFCNLFVDAISYDIRTSYI